MTKPQPKKTKKNRKRMNHFKPKAKPANHVTDRNQFIGDIRRKLDKIQLKIAATRDDGSRFAGNLKKKADSNLTKLDSKYSVLKNQLDELKTSTKENWNTDKLAIQKSFQDLSTNVKNLFK
jgi:hypothetical protein